MERIENYGELVQEFFTERKNYRRLVRVFGILCFIPAVSRIIESHREHLDYMAWLVDLSGCRTQQTI